MYFYYRENLYKEDSILSFTEKDEIEQQIFLSNNY